MVQIQAMFKSFQVIYPHFQGPMSAAESVEMQKKVIENLTLEQSGAFLSHLGNKQWL